MQNNQQKMNKVTLGCPVLEIWITDLCNGMRKTFLVYNMQKTDISDLHMLRYCHLETISRQKPKKLRDQAEWFAVLSKDKRKEAKIKNFNQ